MKIVVAGGSGFLGRSLVRSLLDRGDEVVVLSRDPNKVRVGRGATWDAVNAEVSAADAVVNLAGENVGKRWTDERRKRVIDSRVKATDTLVAALRAAPPGKRAFISASAVGFYGPRGDEVIDEGGRSGDGFLAEVTRRWEAAAREAEPFVRVVILRFGVVLAGEKGGALARMIVPFRFGAGGPVGSGRQWMSWIDRADAVRMIEWALENEAASGTYNATAPEPVTSRDFARALGRALHRPAFLPAPAFALRLLFGRMAEEMLLSGQRVVPARALSEGFTFAYPTVDAALRHAIAASR